MKCSSIILLMLLAVTVLSDNIWGYLTLPEEIAKVTGGGLHLRRNSPASPPQHELKEVVSSESSILPPTSAATFPSPALSVVQPSQVAKPRSPSIADRLLEPFQARKKKARDAVALKAETKARAERINRMNSDPQVWMQEMQGVVHYPSEQLWSQRDLYRDTVWTESLKAKEMRYFRWA